MPMQINHFTCNAQARPTGYVLPEADSKAEIIEVCARFWPLFHIGIMEIVPTADAGPPFGPELARAGREPD